jgi:hypothetical protein
MEYSLVESSEITGEGERCSSTESGWTLYLASPLNDDDNNVHEVDDGDVDSDVSAEFHDSTGENRVEEDDSLASDASTGNIERNDATRDDHVNHRDYDGYHSHDDGYSNHSTNIKEKFKKTERREEKRCFGGLFKRGGSSSSSGSKSWKTKLTW